MLSPFLRIGVSCRQKGPKIALGVADPVEAAACLYVISSTKLSSPRTSVRSWPSLRRSVLHHPCRSVSSKQDSLSLSYRQMVRDDEPHLAGPVQHLHPSHVLIRSQIDFPCKVVDMADEGGHDFAEPRVGFGACGGDDGVGEGWVVLHLRIAVGLCGGHIWCCELWCFSMGGFAVGFVFFRGCLGGLRGLFDVWAQVSVIL